MKTEQSQAKPMTIWCLLVMALVAIVIAMGAALYFTTAGHNGSLEKSTPTAPTLAK